MALYAKETTLKTLECTIGNVTFRVTSDDPSEVFVTTCADGTIGIEDSESLGELVELAEKLARFRNAVGAER